VLTDKQIDVFSNFFADGAKIIFGSLVIGVFAPGSAFSWKTFLSGLFIAVLFLIFAVLPLRKGKS